MNRRNRIAYHSGLVGYFGLLTLMVVWNTVIAPSAHLPIALALSFSCLPLLLVLRGLLHGRPRTNLWAAYLSLGYFIHGVMEVAAAEPQARLWPGLEIVFSLLLFFGATFYTRFLMIKPVDGDPNPPRF